MAKELLIFGFGYSAQAVARRLTGADIKISATSRTPDRFDSMSAAGVRPVAYDDTKLVASILDEADAVLITAGTTETGCPIFADYGLMVKERCPSWIGYLSSNGVYGDHNGAWVDETAPLNATSRRGLARIKAEKQWMGVEQSVVFRLPGIYGPGRSAIDQVRAGRARRIIKPNQVFSRAHVDDIAAAVVASMNNPTAGSVFNVADDLPAPPQDVILFACDLLGMPPPPEEPIETADLSEMARSFYADNKRVRNDRMKSDLSVSLTYPTYREGLQAIYATTK
ncbi:MAG: SDR family oxidoreductase [Pseudomonadota bacterium]